MLFQAWTQKAHRPTRDLDLLGQGNPSPEHCEKVFREICDISVADDGLVFFPETVRVEKIKEVQEYEGVRVKFLARLENARIPLQVDIGFGDAVTPSVLRYPTLLPMPAPRIQAYPMDTVVAEKAEAIVSLGMLNSRMKDFFDIWFLARTFQFEGRALSDAVRATFGRRGTQLDSDGLASLLAELADETSKRTQWRAFLRKSSLAAPDDFAVVNGVIREFLLWPMDAADSAREAPASWLPGGPWSDNLTATTFAET
jgi:hypothetical protein